MHMYRNREFLLVKQVNALHYACPNIEECWDSYMHIIVVFNVSLYIPILRWFIMSMIVLLYRGLSFPK